MTKPKKIPIKTAKEIAQLGYDEVIIVGCNYGTGIQHVTTYGKSIAACKNAAVGGNAIKRLLKWPEDKCNAKPARQIKREKYEAMEKVLAGIVSAIDNPYEDNTLNLARLVGMGVLAKNVVGDNALDKYKDKYKDNNKSANMWIDNDMVRYASLCVHNQTSEAYSELLDEYKKKA